MTTYTQRFEPVTLQTSKRLPCPDCGKKVRRQRTFEQTISPFNSNVKPGMTRRDAFEAISAALEEQAIEWGQQPETCTPCSEKETA